MLPRFCGSAPTLPTKVTLFTAIIKTRKFALKKISLDNNFYISFVKGEGGRNVNHVC